MDFVLIYQDGSGVDGAVACAGRDEGLSLNLPATGSLGVGVARGADSDPRMTVVIVAEVLPSRDGVLIMQEGDVGDRFCRCELEGRCWRRRISHPAHRPSISGSHCGRSHWSLKSTLEGNAHHLCSLFEISLLVSSVTFCVLHPLDSRQCSRA